MYAARMTMSHGSCCMTGEMCAFSYWDPKWFEGDRWNRNTKRDLSTIAPYSHQELARNGYTIEGGSYMVGKGETLQEAWENVLKAVQQHVDRYSYKGTQVRYFWFVRYRTEDKFQNDELRQIVANLPGVVKLGAYYNANSTNEVDGYLVPFTNTKGMDPEDDDYDEDNDE